MTKYIVRYTRNGKETERRTIEANTLRGAKIMVKGLVIDRDYAEIFSEDGKLLAKTTWYELHTKRYGVKKESRWINY